MTHKSPRMSIGMPVHTDFDGPLFTCLNILMTNRGPFEINVVDNNPTAKESESLRKALKTMGGNPRVQINYHEYTAKMGTAAPKNECVRVASCPHTVVCDSHIAPLPGVLDRLADFWSKNPDCPDLIQGPILLYNLVDMHTHFNDSWGSGSWGQWGSAWRCPCDPVLSAKFAPVFQNETKTMAYKSMTLPQVDVRLCSNCGMTIPQNLPAGDHVRALLASGYMRMGREDNETAFDIPGQGMGLFSVAKKHWVGFPPELTEFGGEEMIIHEMTRQAGHRCLCFPWLKWAHRFARNGGVQYPISSIGKLRNFIIGFHLIGFDDSALKDHFLNGPSKIAPEVYAALWNDFDHPRAELEEMQKRHRDGRPAIAPGIAAPKAGTYEELSAAVRDDHFDALQLWAADCPRVTEISKHQESSVALLGIAPSLISYTSDNGPTLDLAATLRPDVAWTRHSLPAHEVEDIEETDFLYLDGVQTFAAVKDYLFRFGPKVQRVIAIRGAQAYGFTSEDGTKPGLLSAFRAFLIEHMEWTLVEHYTENGGLAILSRCQEHKQQFPPMVSMTEDSAAGNLFKAVKRFVTKPGFVELPVYEARIGCCILCKKRNGDQCGICRCYVVAKAKLKNERCPVNFWEQAEAEGLSVNVEGVE
jgi:hypothetical protein